MGKGKQNIKALPKTASEQEGGIENRVVFTIFCKDVVDAIKKQLPKKPSSVKQVVTYSLLSMDESTKKEVLDLIKENKKFDRTIEGFITSNKKKILEFFEKQKDKNSNVSALKQRIAELEAKVGGKDE